MITECLADHIGVAALAGIDIDRASIKLYIMDNALEVLNNIFVHKRIIPHRKVVPIIEHATSVTFVRGDTVHHNAVAPRMIDVYTDRVDVRSQGQRLWEAIDIDNIPDYIIVISSISTTGSTEAAVYMVKDKEIVRDSILWCAALSDDERAVCIGEYLSAHHYNFEVVLREVYNESY